jgi:hypothetical protein
MARSSSIWIVLRKEQILGAFTVKHEMVSYLERFGIVTDLAVTRVPDGGPADWNYTHRSQERFTAKELLGWA